MECPRSGFRTSRMQCVMLYVMGWTQKLTKLLIVVMYIVAVKGQHVIMMINLILDQLEDGTLFGCLFEIGAFPDRLHIAHAGVATTIEAQ